MLGLFRRSYERRPNGFDAPTWQLVALPETGALADQDAWTMAALAWVRDVSNRLEQDLLNAAIARRQPATQADHEPEMSHG